MVPPLALKSGNTKLFVTEKAGPVAGDKAYLRVCGVSRRRVFFSLGLGDFVAGAGKAVRAFARMPNHAMRLHEWGTRDVAGSCLSFAAAVGPVGLDLDGAGFAGGVVVEAAPAIVFWFGDEAASDWVAVDVTDFLYELSRREGVEVVVAGLPEVFAGAFEEFGGFSLDDSKG